MMFEIMVSLREVLGAVLFIAPVIYITGTIIYDCIRSK